MTLAVSCLATAETQVNVASPPTAFFSKTYDEAMALLVETRDYVAHGAGADRGSWTQADGLHMSGEILRVTARLTQITAWLLVQKAVHAGEISPAEAVREDRRLGGHGVCLDTAMHDSHRIPPRLRSLLERSHRLYVRVARLDELIAGTALA